MLDAIFSFRKKTEQHKDKDNRTNPSSKNRFLAKVLNESKIIQSNAGNILAEKGKIFQIFVRIIVTGKKHHKY